MITFQQEAIRVARTIGDVITVAWVVFVCAWALAGYFG
jgi:hypothetical protein